MKITTDKDESVNYEVCSVNRKIFNFFFLPVMNNLPTSFSKLIKKTNRSAKDVLDNATTHSALEVLYNNGYPKKSKSFLAKIFHKIWFGTINARSVRNRLRLTKKEIKKKIRSIIDSDKKDINIISIAAGSARAVIEAIKEEKVPSDVRVSLFFLDKNPRAVEYSKKLSEQLLSGDNLKFTWITDTISSFIQNNNNFFDIVEMVGLLDYFDDDKLKKTINSIYSILNDEGVLITANISDNPERKFVHNVLGWKMIYREPEYFGELIRESGFGDDKIEVKYEPLKVHCVAVAKK